MKTSSPTSQSNFTKDERSMKDHRPSNNISFQSATMHTILEIHSAQEQLLQENLISDSERNGDKTINDKSCDNEYNMNDVRSKPHCPLHHLVDIRLTGMVICTDMKNEYIIVGDPLHKPMASKSRVEKMARMTPKSKPSFSSNSVQSGYSNSNPAACTDQTRIQGVSVFNRNKPNILETPLSKNRVIDEETSNISAPTHHVYKTPTASTNNCSILRHSGSINKKRKLITVKKNFTSISTQKLLSRKKDKKLIYQPKYKSTPKNNNGDVMKSALNSRIDCLDKDQNKSCNIDVQEGDNEMTIKHQQISSYPPSSPSISSPSIASATKKHQQAKHILIHEEKSKTAKEKDMNVLTSTNNIIDPNLLAVIHQNINQGKKMILIDIKNGKHDVEWKVGDLVMIIGKFLIMRNSDFLCNYEDEDRFHIVHSYTNKLHSLATCKKYHNQAKREECCSKESLSSTTATPSQRAIGCYIEARIVKNVNGTDVNLMYKALQLRRQYLQRIKVS